MPREQWRHRTRVFKKDGRWQFACCRCGHAQLGLAAGNVSQELIFGIAWRHASVGGIDPAVAELHLLTAPDRAARPKEVQMDDVIKALQVFKKYVEPGSPEDKWPFQCSHDVLYVRVRPELVSAEDILELEELGFMVGENDFENGFYSYRFGSC